jgi:parvulin-like peptidyl-prolyl isomerase
MIRFAALFIAALFLVPTPTMAKDGHVAKIGSVPVTQYEVQRKAQRLLPMAGGYHKGVSAEKIAEVRETALQELIEQAYKVQFAIAEKIPVDNAAVEERVKPIFAQFKNKKELQKALGGETVDAFRATVYRELAAQRAEEVAVTTRVQVTDEQVRAFYDRHQETYKRPRQFKASHILIKVDPSSNAGQREDLLRKAEDLLARAKAGEDFYNLAYYHSDDRSRFVGGDLGYFHEGQTVKEFEEALKTMAPGDISGLVKSMYGFHVIKCVENNDPRQLTFDEVQDRIRQSLEKKERERLYEGWMAELKAKYPLQRLEP